MYGFYSLLPSFLFSITFILDIKHNQVACLQRNTECFMSFTYDNFTTRKPQSE